MADRRVNHEAALTLEQPLLKVSYEQLHKSFRATRKYLEKELSLLGGKDATSKTADGALNTVTRINQLKRKLVETQLEEQTCLKRCKARIQYLTQLHQFKTVDDPDYDSWSQVRLNRLLVDYLLRRGYLDTAEKLCQTAGLDALVDLDLFLGKRKVEQALQNRTCHECLQWCADNRSNLRKNKSSLEFNLRLQEFIELVRREERAEAVQYARKHFPAWVETHMKEIQRAMALLAFGPRTECPPYKRLFADTRWDELVQQFRQDSFALNNLTAEPLLNITLQAGLTALKTPHCYKPRDKNTNCPVCDPVMGQLAEQLPFSHHINSCVVCRISGAVMDEDNPPMVLPNGNAYSLQALKAMADSTGGKIVDPRTQQTFDFATTKKAFLT